MPSKRKQDMYAAEAATGAGLGAVVASNRVPEMANGVVRLKRRSDAWHAETRQAGGLGKTKDGRYLKLNLINNDDPKKKPVVLDDQGRPQPRPRKSERMFAAERMKNEARETRAKANHSNHVPFPEGRWEKDVAGKKIWRDPATKKLKPAALGELRRKAVLAVGLPVAVGVGFHGAHKWAKTRDARHKQKQYNLRKRMDKNDVDGAVAGGLIGASAYQVPSHLEWIGRKKQAEKIKATVPNADEIIDAWKTKYDVHGRQKGQKQWKKAYRNYPKELDVKGWRNARLQSRLYTGKSGAALTGAAGLAGAAAGVPVVRAINRKRGVKRVD